MREIVAAKYFGVTGPMSAFTIAFQVPNLMRALFADAALQAAFVPVFTELLEKGRRREALNVAWSLFSLMVALLGALTLVFFFVAPWVMALVTPGFHDNPELRHLTVQLSRIMFPVVMLLALSGLVVGMLNSLEHFNVPALTPVIWNLIIIGCLVFLTPVFHARRPRSTPTRSECWPARSFSSYCRCRGCSVPECRSRSSSTGATNRSGVS